VSLISAGKDKRVAALCLLAAPAVS
jgi:hypothetical protein